MWTRSFRVPQHDSSAGSQKCGIVVLMNLPPATLRIAYMTGEYPRATDTFIQREVAALRTSGVYVQTFAIRKPHIKENVGPETEAERARTFYIFPPRPLKIIGAHLK